MVSISSSHIHVSMESADGISVPVLKLPLGMRSTLETGRLLLERFHDRELMDLVEAPIEVYAYHPRLCEAVELLADSFEYKDIVEHPDEPLVWT